MRFFDTNTFILDCSLIQFCQYQFSFSVQYFHIGIMVLNLNDADIISVYALDAADGTDQISRSQLFAFSCEDA